MGALIRSVGRQLPADCDRCRTRVRRSATGFPIGWAREIRNHHRQDVAALPPPASGPDPARACIRREMRVLRRFFRALFGPLRASVPLAAGILEMPWWPFQIANFASAFIWAAMLLILGDGIPHTFRWMVG